MFIIKEATEFRSNSNTNICNLRNKGLRREARDLKECVADLTLKNQLLKKNMIADGEDIE